MESGSGPQTSPAPPPGGGRRFLNSNIVIYFVYLGMFALPAAVYAAAAALGAGGWRPFGFAGAAAAAGALVIYQVQKRKIARFEAAILRFADGKFDVRGNFLPGDEWSGAALALQYAAGNFQARAGALALERDRLMAVWAGMSDPLMLAGENREIIMANEAFHALFDLPPGSANGRPFAEVIASREIVQFIDECIELRTARQREFALARPGWQARHFRLGASAARAEGGPFRGAAIIFHDISPIRETDHLRREFMANASHELKTPLSSLLGIAETLLDREPPDAATRARFYHIMEENASRLHRLINDLIELSEIEQQRVRMNPAPLDIDEEIRSILRCVRPAADVKGHTIAVEISGAPLPPFVVDRQIFNRIIENLLDNAIKYTDPGGKIRIEAAREESLLRIRIEDSGIGIGESDLLHIFERFYRVDKGRSIRAGGTGLGLAIVKHAVEALGGEISVESQLGKGTAFIVRLPWGGTGSTR